MNNHAHPGRPPTPSMCNTAAASKPEKAEAKLAAENTTAMLLGVSTGWELCRRLLRTVIGASCVGRRRRGKNTSREEARLYNIEGSTYGCGDRDQSTFKQTQEESACQQP